jgi:EpsI family protein
MTFFRRSALPFAGTFILLAGTLAASWVSSKRLSGNLARPLETISSDIAGFHGSDNPALNTRVMGRLLPTSYLSRTYRKADLSLELLIVYYAQQRAGESMHSPKHCLPGAGWEIWNYGALEIPVKGQPTTINKYSVSRSGQRMLVLYWYQSPGRIIANEYVGKLLLARDALLQNTTDASIVRIVLPDSADALRQAAAFAAEVLPQIQRCFGDS